MTYPRGREMPPDVRSYEQAVRDFVWQVPEHFNIWEDVCGRHASGPAASRTAMVYEDIAGTVTRLNFGAVGELVERLSAVFADQGLRRGDRVAILLPQRPETALAHLAA